MATYIKTTDELKDIINKAKDLVVLEFSAKWCSACSLMSPEIEKIAAINNVINFCIIDVDDNEELADQYNIIALPTVHFIKGDSILETIIGAKIEMLYKILNRLYPEGPFPEYVPVERKRKMKLIPEPESEEGKQEGEIAAALLPTEKTDTNNNKEDSIDTTLALDETLKEDHKKPNDDLDTPNLINPPVKTPTSENKPKKKKNKE